MSVDRQLQEQVLAALEREPGVEAAHVGVSVLDGVVTLQGIVRPSARSGSRNERHAWRRGGALPTLWRWLVEEGS